MAESPSHRFGQVVGQLLEEILLPELLRFCDDRGLYLDRHGSRVGVRKGKKVSWEDRFGNIHDLDFVIEKDGTSERRGRPVAFVEAAWRRYTKHSRAKAQEIQGAILPIAERYEVEAPFLGAVLAGVFTKGSLDQLSSLGFQIAFIPYETIIEGFAAAGVNARFDETTADSEFRACVDKIEALPSKAREIVKSSILLLNNDVLSEFMEKLRRKLDRTPERVMILPLFGNNQTFASVAAAAAYLEEFDCAVAGGQFKRFEVRIDFSNSDEVRGLFSTKEEALQFLRYATS